MAWLVSTAIFMICCAILTIVPVVFVVNKVYQDGLIGRMGLLGISFFAATFLLEFLAGAEYEMLWQSTFLVLSFTVFLCWHLFRFEMRCMVQRLRG